MTDSRPQYRYGEPNWEMLGRWMQITPDEDGPFWALNLMKYRTVADYVDGEGPTRSGKEADDAYAPLGPLAAIGAMVAFHGDVEEQFAGEPSWDRVGIVRYPSRSAFFAMQQRDDFKAQHVHKDAGMEFTIVMSTLPEGPTGDPAADGVLVLRVRRFTDEAARPTGEPEPLARFDVEGVIVGDDRVWHEARFDLVPGRAAVDGLLAPVDGVDEMQAVVLTPQIDNLVESIHTAPDVAAG